jgi:hypothetical protein
MTDLVTVTRSGGITGRSLSAELLLTVGDARSAQVQELLARIPFDDLPAARPQPDRYTYTFSLDDRQFVVAEQDLTGDLEELARLVLGT